MCWVVCSAAVMVRARADGRRFVVFVCNPYALHYPLPDIHSLQYSGVWSAFHPPPRPVFFIELDPSDGNTALCADTATGWWSSNIDTRVTPEASMSYPCSC